MTAEQQAKRVEAAAEVLACRPLGVLGATLRRRYLEEAGEALAAADEAVPVAAASITDEMVERALLAFWDDPMPHYRARDLRKMRAALAAALNQDGAS